MRPEDLTKLCEELADIVCQVAEQTYEDKLRLDKTTKAQKPDMDEIKKSLESNFDAKYKPNKEFTRKDLYEAFQKMLKEFEKYGISNLKKD